MACHNMTLENGMHATQIIFFPNNGLLLPNWTIYVVYAHMAYAILYQFIVIYWKNSLFF